MRSDVPAIDLDGWLGAFQRFGGVSGGDFALFPGQQRNIVVLPQDRKNLVATGALIDFEAHGEGQRLAGVFEGHTGDFVRSLRHGRCRNFHFGGRQSVEGAEIGELACRRVIPVRTLFWFAKRVGLCGEPVEVPAYWKAGGVFQREDDKIGRSQAGWLGQNENTLAFVGGDIHSGLLREFFGHVEIVNPGRGLEVRKVLVIVIDNNHRTVVVGILDVERFTGNFRAEIAAARTEVEIVKMPDHRGPRIVHHPLNHAGGVILVAPVSLEHRALAVVGHHLGFARVILNSGGIAQALLQGLGKNIQLLERSASGVEPPRAVNGPEVLFGKHPAQTLNGRDGRSRTGLGIERICASGLFIDVPIDGRDVLVRTGHAHAGRLSRWARFAAGGG